MKTTGDGDSPADLENAIGRTRVEIGATLEALERQLAARNIVEKGLDMLNETMGGYEGVTRFVRDNPVPVALFGLGAAWLLASNTGLVDRVASSDIGSRASDLASNVGNRASDLASNVGNRASDLASNVAGKVGLGGSGDRALGHTGNPIVDEQGERDENGWMHQVSGAASGALRSARDSSGAVLNRAGGMAGDGYGRVADQISDTFERHPLIIGAVGLMAGALLAAVLPATEVENELLGETRDQLIDQATDLGTEAVTHVRDTAVKAVQAAAGAAASAAASAAAGAAATAAFDGKKDEKSSS